MTNTLDELERLMDAATQGLAEPPVPTAEGILVWTAVQTRYVDALREAFPDLLAVARAAEEVMAWITADGEAMEEAGHIVPYYPFEDTLNAALARLSPPSEEGS